MTLAMNDAFLEMIETGLNRLKESGMLVFDTNRNMKEITKDYFGMINIDVIVGSKQEKDECIESSTKIDNTREPIVKQENIEFKNSTITITFGDVAENHASMQKIGTIASTGITITELQEIMTNFQSLGNKCEWIDLNSALSDDDKPKAASAALLVIRNGLDNAFGIKPDELFKEHTDLPVDKKALMRGRVVNKHARHNLCFSEMSQEPDYENGKGRIVKFEDVPLTNIIRTRLPDLVGEKSMNLQAEGNYYYDNSKCGIGFHGDGERKIVIAIRLGSSSPLHYQWFHQTKPVGNRIELNLNHGDMYIMSDKAVGFDWKKRTIYTLRHAAGSSKFLKI